MMVFQNSGMLYSDEKYVDSGHLKRKNYFFFGFRLDRKLLKICLDDGEVVREPNVSSSTLIENKSEMKSIKQERIAEVCLRNIRKNDQKDQRLLVQKKELMIEKKSKQMTEKNEKEKIPEKSKVNTFNNV